jgi:hypothetical protein
MIRGINAGPHLTISDGYAPTPTFSPGAQSAGMVRYNTNMQCMEVYDGQGWQTLYTAHPTVDLAPASREAVEWAMRKQHEERKLKDMMERHPGLKELHDKFEMMKVLCQEEEKNNA